MAHFGISPPHLDDARGAGPRRTFSALTKRMIRPGPPWPAPRDHLFEARPPSRGGSAERHGLTRHRTSRYLSMVLPACRPDLLSFSKRSWMPMKKLVFIQLSSADGILRRTSQSAAEHNRLNWKIIDMHYETKDVFVHGGPPLIDPSLPLLHVHQVSGREPSPTLPVTMVR